MKRKRFVLSVEMDDTKEGMARNLIMAFTAAIESLVDEECDSGPLNRTEGGIYTSLENYESVKTCEPVIEVTYRWEPVVERSIHGNHEDY